MGVPGEMRVDGIGAGTNMYWNEWYYPWVPTVPNVIVYPVITITPSDPAPVEVCPTCGEVTCPQCGRKLKVSKGKKKRANP